MFPHVEGLIDYRARSGAARSCHPWVYSRKLLVRVLPGRFCKIDLGSARTPLGRLLPRWAGVWRPGKSRNPQLRFWSGRTAVVDLASTPPGSDWRVAERDGGSWCTGRPRAVREGGPAGGKSGNVGNEISSRSAASERIPLRGLPRARPDADLTFPVPGSDDYPGEIIRRSPRRHRRRGADPGARRVTGRSPVVFRFPGAVN